MNSPKYGKRPQAIVVTVARRAADVTELSRLRQGLHTLLRAWARAEIERQLRVQRNPGRTAR